MIEVVKCLECGVALFNRLIFRFGCQSRLLVRQGVSAIAVAGIALVLGACGGHGSSSSLSAPEITVQPQSLTVRSTQVATFGVSAKGKPDPTYQWQKDGVDIPGANAASYSVATTSASDAGTYRAVVKNSQGTVVSNAVTLTVHLTLLFNGPAGVAVDSAGNVYVANTAVHTICKIRTDGTVITLAGSPGQPGSSDGSGSSARFTYPTALAVNGAGILYVADGNNTVRSVTPSGVVSTLAGMPGLPGTVDGSGSSARFGDLLQGLAMDSNGNLLVSDTLNHTIRLVTPTGDVSTVAGIAGQPGSADGALGVAKLNNPSGLVVSPTGNIYIADFGSATLRMISPSGVLSTVAGQAGTAGSADGMGTAARFNGLTGVAADSLGRIYIVDTYNSTIRKLDTTGVISTIAGVSEEGGNVDGAGATARFNRPTAIVADGTGNFIVADSYNGIIRKVATDGTVTTLVAP